MAMIKSDTICAARGVRCIPLVILLFIGAISALAQKTPW